MDELDEIATIINDTVEKAVNHVAASKITVGQYLLQARLIINDDNDFGAWRRDNTVVQSKQHAHYLMQIAKRFGDAPKLIESVNYSTLQELVLADEVDIKWVQEKVAENKPPTVKEVRVKVKQTQAERLAPREQKGTSKKAGVSKTGVTPPNLNINQIVTMGLTKRIGSIADIGDTLIASCIVLGMDPDPQTPCHPIILELIHAHWASSTDSEIEKEVVQLAYEAVKAEFEGWYK